jgi:cholesterol oxidase
MTGCRHAAKNTLVKNCLHLAEQAGAVVISDTTVVALRPLDHGGYAVDTQRSGAWICGRSRGVLTANNVVVAAGTWGTHQLLHRKDEGTLPHLSDRLGMLTRTNSEALCGAVGKCATAATSPKASRSPRRSTPTTPPTSNRSATAKAPTPWGCMAR